MRRQTLAVTAAASLAAAALTSAGTTADAAQSQQQRVRHIAYHQWSGTTALRRGTKRGVVVDRRGVRIGNPVGRRGYNDPHGGGGRIRYAFGRWTSPWVRPGFGLTEAIASWDASTPRGTWVAVEMRGRTPSGRLSSWDSLGRWASHERRFHRTTLGGQGDDVARVAVDTLQTRKRFRLSRWQLRVTLYRRAGTSATPRLHTVGAMASRVPENVNPPTTRPGVARGRGVAVPRRSQMIHRGHYPRWGGGGQAWCSPTSTTMLLSRWRRGPRPRAYSWVPDGHRNPAVDFAARSVFDYGYDGAGNWAFNTAYANRYGTKSFVTRLRSLREAERFIRAGIPLVASISFGSGELDGSPISGTNGHLLVIRGFTGGGRVVVNDPAARRNTRVRRVYRRDQFADAWIGGSGGVVYVIRPAGRSLPRRKAEANW
ncbi:MAG: C39 family peptidase [Nocardioidaceae bacterium]